MSFWRRRKSICRWSTASTNCPATSSRANSLTIRGAPDVGPGAFGVTSCYRSGDGATKQEPGDYGLIATRHEQEGGVFRVDYRTGALSICYLYFQREKQGDHEAIADQYVVCTPPWKQTTAAPARSGGTVSELPAAAPTRD